MLSEPSIKSAIHNGLVYLSKEQRADGGFVSYSSVSAKPFDPLITYSTTFVPSLILASLAGINSREGKDIRNRLARFLLLQKSPIWSFNYWAQDASERRSQPYPDDLDDTFCALIGLFLHDPAIINEEVLAGVVKLLLATETTAGGPYRTWLVAPNAPKTWLDTDLAVNSNVNYFLGLVSNALPNLEAFMEQAILGSKLVSPYYPSSYPLIYYFSRSYRGVHSTALRLLTRRLQQAKTITPLEQALCLTALINLGETSQLEGGIAKLLLSQNEDGSWPAGAFCMDPAHEGKPYYNGAPALTTAFAIETLQLYLGKDMALKSPANNRKTAPGETEKLQATLLVAAKRQCQDLGKDLRTTTISALEQIASSTNGPEIMALPYRFNQSLSEPLASVPSDFFMTLGLANLYGWLAYTIYDDFLDEEGKPELIPVANVAMRGSLRCFNEFPPSNQMFQTIVQETFDSIDGANAWEMAHCRFVCQDRWLIIDKPLPDYGDLSKLAERSLGHTLTPLAILLAKDFNIGSKAYRQTRKALKHYLIARQLNDDAHDWQTDIQKGHITYVVGVILTEMDVKSGRHHLDNLLPAMQRQFWHHSLPVICQQMQRQVTLSRQALKQNPDLQPANAITKFLDGIEASIKNTLSTQTQADNFLKHYKRKVH